MTATRRPIVAIPARFSASASALRFEADVTARRLVDAVWAAGGEPVVLHPVAPVGDAASAGERIDPVRGFAALTSEYVEQVATRVAFADAVLLPGGGDVSPIWTGDALHDTHYDVDVEQDAFDFALARVIIERGVPALAICRGMQLLNVALGGTLHFDMDDELGVPAHRRRIADVALDPASRLARVLGAAQPVDATASGPPGERAGGGVRHGGEHAASVRASCFHHQCLKDVAPGWRVVARSSEGVTEAVELDGDEANAASIVAVQWHPEDTYDTDPQQFALFSDLIERARKRR